ncbi:MAG: hypothetical protein IAF08_06725 [Rhizobacter sp.]|nr:hypothetical protein [Chlorobiales bacterium]
MNLIDLIKRFRGKLSVALSLVVIENVAWILEPAIFGGVIDAMIGRVSSTGLRPQLFSFDAGLFPLAVWIGVYAINSGTGVLRRIVDQKIFLGIFTHLAADVARIAKGQGHSVSRTAARAQLSREYITFCQYRLPEILEQIIAIVGAMIALAAFDWRIAAACSTMILPLVVLNLLYSKRVSISQKEYHDRYEDIYEVFAAGDPERVKAYYTALARPQQRIANWGAFNFGVMRVVLLAVFLVVLYISIDLNPFTTGTIYAIVAYLWTFVSSSEYLPELMESWTSIKDISRRLHDEGDDRNRTPVYQPAHAEAVEEVH